MKRKTPRPNLSEDAVIGISRDLEAGSSLASVCRSLNLPYQSTRKFLMDSKVPVGRGGLPVSQKTLLLVESWDAGETINEMGRKYGLSKQRICKALKTAEKHLMTKRKLDF